MIETNRWLARLNSALCCQIESFFGDLGADMKGPSARTLSASKPSELKIGVAIKLGPSGRLAVLSAYCGRGGGSKKKKVSTDRARWRDIFATLYLIHKKFR